MPLIHRRHAVPDSHRSRIVAGTPRDTSVCWLLPVFAIIVKSEVLYAHENERGAQSCGLLWLTHAEARERV